MTIKPTPSSNGRRPQAQQHCQRNKPRSSHGATESSHRGPLDHRQLNNPNSYSPALLNSGSATNQPLLQASNEATDQYCLRPRLNNLAKSNTGQRRRQAPTQGRRKKRISVKPAGNGIAGSSDTLRGPPFQAVPAGDHGQKRNSEDEYDLTPAEEAMPAEDLCQLEVRFRTEIRRRRGLRVKNMKSDGNCLFRAIADQVYGDEELHLTVRRKCMDHIAMNQASFCQYLTEDIDAYIARKRRNHEFGNYVEMIALSEVFRRPIELYHYGCDPSNTFTGERANVDHPMRISYHIGGHYNSIVQPGASFIVPFGPDDMNTGPFLKCADSAFDDGNPNSVIERDQIEQAMLDDKLRATDYEATDAEILHAVKQASYFDWLQEHQLRRQTEFFQIFQDVRQTDSKANKPSVSSHSSRPYPICQKDWTAECSGFSDAADGRAQGARIRNLSRRANNCLSGIKRDARSGSDQALGVLPSKRAARKIERTVRSPLFAREVCPARGRDSPGPSRELSPLSCSSKDSLQRN